MSASFALAGLVACTKQPLERIVPYVKQPEELVPGKPLSYATAIEIGGFAQGLLATSYDGRPTKLEGNPDHPASLGATSIFGQAAILDLYDPDRSQAILHAGAISTWEAFAGALHDALAAPELKQGAGLRILTESITSPTLAAQLQAVLAKFPRAKWHQYQPIARDSIREGALLAFGEDVEPHYHFDKADVIVALDSDFLFNAPGALRYAREFADRRRVSTGRAEMSRVYVVEPTPTVTGSNADHRLPVPASAVRAIAEAIAIELKLLSARLDQTYDSAFVSAAAADLREHRGAGLVIAGIEQPPAVHVLAHAMNSALGNIGNTVTFTAPVETNRVNQTQSLRELIGDMESGAVDLLVILGGNPAFTAPADLDFAAHLSKVKTRVHLGLYVDETAEQCHWHIPAAHFLEAWSDTRAFDGTVSITQPLIEPLYRGKSAHELVDAFLNLPARGSSYDIVREHWRSQKPWTDFEKGWRKAVHDGVIAGTALPARQVTLRADALESLGARPPAMANLEISFRADPCVWDGRFANNGWLQELPKPITK
ncbi:MAG TPA: hypothetical protein VEO95_12745, partial [Chthoniobacteraceae bacterium]|nr:hypothetical protein [Chthoniobacteraceae bacterium]